MSSTRDSRLWDAGQPTSTSGIGLPRIISSLDVDNHSDCGVVNDDHFTSSCLSPEFQHHRHHHPLHLILHFDINETILVGDEVGGDSREDCFNKIMAKSAFCQIPQQISSSDDTSSTDNNIPPTEQSHNYDVTSAVEPTHWWDGTQISSPTKPSSPVHVPPLYTGWKWPPGCCPYYRTAFKRVSKSFVQHHGNIYRPLYQEIEARLAPISTTGSTPLSIHHHLHHTFYNILPAFFHTIYTLVRRQQTNQQPPFTLVFRTFGTDLPQIAKAMTAFANGQHPDYPDFCHPEYALDQHSLYKAKWVPVVSAEAAEGEEAQPPNRINSTSPDLEQPRVQCQHHEKNYYQYQLRDTNGTVAAAGDEEVLQLFHNTTHTNYVYGIQDDYSFWKQNQWEPWAGKPVWITPSSSVLRNGGDAAHDDSPLPLLHHHILLDDNIHNLPHDGIAGVRRPRRKRDNETQDQATHVIYESLSGPEIQNMHGLHLIRVLTIEPIMNIDWFLEQIDKVLKERQQRHG